MEQSAFSKEELSELIRTNSIVGKYTFERNNKLKYGFMKSFLGWFSMCGIGAGINAINSILHGRVMPVWNIWDYEAIFPNKNIFIESFKWATQSFSNFFGDWIIMGKTYLWSIGDMLLLTSYLFLIISMSKVIYRYIKNI